MSTTTATVNEIVAYAFEHGAERVSSRHDVYAYEEAEWVNGPHGVDRESYEMVAYGSNTAHETVTARWAHGGIVQIRIEDGCFVVMVDSGTECAGASRVPSGWRAVIEEQESGNMNTGQNARVKTWERYKTLLAESGNADDRTVDLHAYLAAYHETANPGGYRTSVTAEGIHLYGNDASVVIRPETPCNENWEVWTTDDNYPDRSCTYDDIEWLGSFDVFDDAFRCAAVEAIGAAS